MLAGLTRSMQRAAFFRIVVLANVMPSSTPGVFDTSTSNGPEAFLTASEKQQQDLELLSIQLYF